MDTTSIDSKSIKTSDPHKLVLNPADKTYLNRIYQISLSFAHEETQKCRTNTKDSNCQQQHGIKNSHYLIDFCVFLIFKVILTFSSKTMKQLMIIPQCKFMLTKMKRALHSK